MYTTSKSRIHKLPQFNLIGDWLDRNSVKWEVAGGYPRDIAQGREPRDLDIACFGFADDDKAAEVQSGLGNFLMGIGAYKDETLGHAYRDSRITGVLMTAVEIDIIFWNAEHQTIQDVVGAFDYNLNQYVMFKGLHGDPSIQFLGSNHGTLEQVRGSDVSDERAAKMEAVAKDARWVVERRNNSMSNQEIDEMLGF